MTALCDQMVVHIIRHLRFTAGKLILSHHNIFALANWRLATRVRYDDIVGISVNFSTVFPLISNIYRF